MHGSRGASSSPSRANVTIPSITLAALMTQAARGLMWDGGGVPEAVLLVVWLFFSGFFDLPPVIALIPEVHSGPGVWLPR